MKTQYAGNGPRILAALIDGIIVSIGAFILGMVLNSAGMSSQNTSMNTGVNLVLSLVYFVGYQSQSGVTLGKKAMGIRVVDSKGAKPTMMTLFLREIVGKFISAIILGIGYLMILWDGRKQGLHDKIAQTYVVKG